MTKNPTIAELCEDPESVDPRVSQTMINTAAKLQPTQNQAEAVLRAALAEALYETSSDPRVTTQTYLDAASSQAEPMKAEIDITAAVEKVIQTLTLDLDATGFVCDSDGTMALQVDGILTVPFRCEDCAEDIVKNMEEN